MTAARHAAFLTAVAAVLAMAGCSEGNAPAPSQVDALRAVPPTTKARPADPERIVARYGGEMADPTLRRYVAGIGRVLAQVGLPGDGAIRFAVLDSPLVNAFAAPGGTIFVTRGLLELASDESELAAVLAHEMAHEEADRGTVTATHALASAAPDAGLAALGGPARAHGPRPTATESAFSRDEEFAADARGIDLLARAGFDPHAMVRFLTKLRARARLDAMRRDVPPDAVDRTGFLANHPATIERLERARARAAAEPQNRPTVGRDAYLDRIDGLPYGDSPGQGVIRGRRFADAALRVAFEVPDGFRLFNAPASVVAYGPDGARIVFDRARDPKKLPPQRYLTDAWGARIALRGVAPIEVNGTKGATALARGTTDAGPVEVRLVALDGGDGTLFRMVFVMPKDAAATLSPAVRRTAMSFRRLSAAEAKEIRPLHLRVVTVGAGDTVESLAARMAFADFRRERFMVLNGLGPDDMLAPGTRVKIVTE